MRALRQVFRAAPWATGLQRAGIAVREALIWGAAIALLEMGGSYAPHDGADLLAMTAAALLGALLVRWTRLGWMPTTARVARALRDQAVRAAQIVSPRHAIVLRVPTGRFAARPDQALLVPAAVLAVLIAAALGAGQSLWTGLLHVKAHVSYVAYLAGLASIWAVLGGVTAVGLFASAGGRGAWARHDESIPSGLRLVGFLVTWSAAVLGMAMLPGAAPLLVVFVLGITQAAILRRRPPATYFLCHRDREGALRGLPVHEYLRRFHGLVLLALLFATALGQARRLVEPSIPSDPFAVTEGLALFASVSSVYLAARAGGHLLRYVARPDQMPEATLVPTLWIPGARAAPEWSASAARHGWVVSPTPLPPPDGFDLVVGEPGDAATFHPREGVDADEMEFLLERRFHVVKRRQFWRRFRSLHKDVVSQEHPSGSGYIFCPHVWLVPGIVRDAEEGRPSDRPPGTLLSAHTVGRPYAEVFPSRLRRYLGAVLRDLRIDMIFWEDGVTWADLRRVLGVAFEVYDQRRSPLLERHFIGVPRVRIVIQEEDDLPESLDHGDPVEDAAHGRRADLRADVFRRARERWRPEESDPRKAARARPVAPEADPPGVHARVLLILRDRGGEVVTPTPSAPGTRQRRPVPV